MGEDVVHLLCSVDGYWACSSFREANSCELSFVNNVSINTALQNMYGIDLLSPEKLSSKFRKLPSTSEVDIKYWKPVTFGEGVFNWWD